MLLLLLVLTGRHEGREVAAGRRRRPVARLGSAGASGNGGGDRGGVHGRRRVGSGPVGGRRVEARARTLTRHRCCRGEDDGKEEGDPGTGGWDDARDLEAGIAVTDLIRAVEGLIIADKLT